SLTRDWNPGAADLLVVKALEDVAETLKLCRFLVSRGIVSTAAGEEVAKTQGQPTERQDQARRAGAPLLVLVPSKRGPLVKAALAAGAESCLAVPAPPAGMARVGVPARHGNHPRRSPLYLVCAPCVGSRGEA